jgi:hypothetical protein
MTQHGSLAAGGWSKLTLLEQMGNIGSEVGRTLRATAPSRRQNAAYRTLELFDMTLDDKRWYGRGNELARTREVFCDYVFGDNQYNSNAADLEKYFMQFAIAARLQR